MTKFLFIAISFVVGWFFIDHLRTYDIHEKEPFGKMALVTVLGGTLAVVLSLLAYELLELFGYDNLRSVAGALLAIGPIEEAAKLIGLAACYLLIRKDLNEPTDGLVYMGCVALGFSLIENYFYAAGSSEGFQVMALRVGLATPMHISFSLMMGLAFYGLLRLNSGWLLLGLSFGYAVLVHGLYDALIFVQDGMLAYYTLVWVLFIALIRQSHMWSLSLLGYATAVSPHRVSLQTFIDEYPEPAVEEGLECLACGDTADKQTYARGQIRIQKCDSCGHFVTSLKSLFLIFHQFGSHFRNLKYHFGDAPDGPEGMSVLYRGNLASSEKELAFFKLEELNIALEEFTRDVVQRMYGVIRNAIRPPAALLAGTPYGADVQPGSPAAAKPVLPNLSLASLVYPFENPHKPKKIYVPPKDGPRWCWPAFFFPGFWFLWHEILGFGVAALLLEFAALMPITEFLGFGAYLGYNVALHLAAGYWAPRIFYYRYGRWPGERGN